MTNAALAIALAGWVLAGWAWAASLLPDSVFPHWPNIPAYKEPYIVLMLGAGLLVQCVATTLTLVARRASFWRYTATPALGSGYSFMVMYLLIGNRPGTAVIPF